MDAFKYILSVLLLTVLFYASTVYITSKKKSKYQIAYYIFVCFLVIFFLVYFSCRLIYANDSTSIGGVDAIIYKTRFENATGSFFESVKDQQYEFGYATIVYMFRQVTDSYVVYQVIYYLFLFALVFYILKLLRLKRGLISFVLIFVYISIPFFDSMNITRNMLAYFLSMLSIVLMYRKRTIPSLLIALFATTIHISAIILLAIYLTYYIICNSKRKKLKYVYVLTIIISVIVLTIMISIFRPVFLKTKYASYFESGNGKVPYGLMVERFAAIFIYFLLKKKRIANKRLNMMSLVIISFAVVITFLQLSLPILYRINVICGIGCFLVFAMMGNGYKALRKTNCKRLAYSFIIMALFVFKINSTVTDTISSYGLVPHYYNWEEGIYT